LRVRFGDLTFDAASRQILKGSTEIHLTLKAFDLLRLLIERRPAVVSKDDIQSHLWPTTFVSEANLPSLIAEIRTALGDTARQPRFIRTVHGFGYAFCGQTEAAGAPVATRSRYSLVWEAKQLALGEGDNVVGRDRDLTVSLDSSSVSRRHCVIRVAGDAVTVEDLDSKNGTFVRDERITGLVPVASGDRIRVGTIVLTLLSDESTLTETQTTHEDDRS
jgi:DNA-binding winged helix-turn-helix (wHTH) protein